jgi:citrate lyase subunit beta/citryl-CoA lyase
MQMVLAARAGGIDVLDGVSNDFRDLDAFARQCGEAAAMGFDGKTLIHPAQIEPANAAFSPAPEAMAEAQAIISAFALPENAGKGVISLGGRMVERLHLAQAEKLLAKAAATPT